MKYLVLFAVVMVVYMMWRNERRKEMDERKTASPRPTAAPEALPQDMVRCERCALHLPRNEALAGPDGRLYCSQEHRAGG